MVVKQAMVLAAGLGKRLRPLTLTTPKPLLPIVGKPIIAHVLDRLRRHGVSRVVVNTHYLADQLEDYLKTISGLDIIISYEPVLLETGGGVLKALSYFDGKPFFAINADTWWQESEDVSLLQRLESCWDDAKMDALLAISSKNQGIEFQGVGDYYIEENKVLRFRAAHSQAPYVFIGVRILHPRLFDGMVPDYFTQPILFHRSEKQQRLHGVLHDHKWCDIGSFHAYRALQEYLDPHHK